MSDYMLSVLMIEPTKVFVFFSFTCITAPTLGVILGGVIIHRQGGYATPNAMNICVVVMGLANTVSIPAAFVENFNVYAMLIWLLLFFGGFVVPIMTGLILSVVKPTEKTVANSVASLAFNILGYLPAPFIYGVVVQLTGGTKSRYGMAFIMFMSLPGLLFCIIARFFLKGKFEDKLQKPLIQKDEQRMRSQLSKKDLNKLRSGSFN